MGNYNAVSPKGEAKKKLPCMGAAVATKTAPYGHVVVVVVKKDIFIRVIVLQSVRRFKKKVRREIQNLPPRPVSCWLDSNAI